MWIPFIVSCVVIIITMVLLSVLEKKERIKENTITYRVIMIFGGYIPMVIMCINYAYLKTDTLKETIIVAIGIFACFALWQLFYSKFKTSKYNFAMFLAVILGSFIILRIINKYMLSDIHSGFYSAYLGAALGTSFANNKYKWRLIITEIIVLIMVIMGPASFRDLFNNNNKVERVSIRYAESMGYDITSQDEVNMRLDPLTIARNEPISVYIVRRKSNDYWTIERYINLVYSNGEIIKFSREK